MAVSTHIHSHSPLFRVQEILQGEYQVVISPPEAFLCTDKLRNIVQASELKDYRHFVVVDEAHIIQTPRRFGHIILTVRKAQSATVLLHSRVANVKSY